MTEILPEGVTHSCPHTSQQTLNGHFTAMVVKLKKKKKEDRLGHYLEASLKREAMFEPVLISKGHGTDGTMPPREGVCIQTHTEVKL